MNMHPMGAEFFYEDRKTYRGKVRQANRRTDRHYEDNKCRFRNFARAPNKEIKSLTLGGIRNLNPSNRAAADPRLRPDGQRYRHRRHIRQANEKSSLNKRHLPLFSFSTF